MADRVAPVALASRLAMVQRPLLEPPLLIGAKAPVAARVVAARVPAAVVKARRRMARTNAKKTGSTPAQTHVTLVAWHLLITHVPETIWQTTTGLKVSPLRWQVALMVQSW